VSLTWTDRQEKALLTEPKALLIDPKALLIEPWALLAVVDNPPTVVDRLVMAPVTEVKIVSILP
jgi:hypothetical protein